ncbi:hypothetical protein N7481_003143 [Penicillium waksmanii]|uniref:uncharacterized protein n=1 Tax=Penicillium waksmanii TaxID=69791 RepID=UPI0025499EC9|nr:uncharacterized protein N7481_003143 [Penicillium waksmanii]KAJ5987933.1 hypothetical protein N7481_003143 [Penicillium waksmanii]
MSIIKVAVATNSLGKSAAGHTIHRKLQAAKTHGFDGLEVAFECLEAQAATYPSLQSRKDRLLAAAEDIYKAAKSLGLELIALNPFGAYDGLKDPHDVNIRLQEAELWCQLCQVMHIDILQSSRRICAHWVLLTQRYDLRVAYEAPSWGIHSNTWQQVQKIIDLVDLPNVGHCLDTFHIASKEAGDPFSSISPIRADGYRNLQSSLDELKRIVKPENIVYFQLSDATAANPDQEGYPRRDMNQPPFMTQSRNCRIYPCEESRGGCLPVVDVAKAVFDLGYCGWVSMEVFHTDMWEKRNSVPDDWARRGMESWKKLARRCGLNSSKL